MRTGATVAALLMAGLIFVVPAARAATTGIPVFGQTLPPIGFVKFCAENPSECQPSPADKTLAMSQEQWNLVYQVNTFVNGKIKPMSDMELYGQPEYWTYPTNAGDCEDYLLLKKRYLEGLGFPSSSLLITVVLDEKSEGHAVLTISTSEGDFILDNRRNSVLAWDKTNYSFLKRQSDDNPKKWVALSRKQAKPDSDLASNAH